MTAPILPCCHTLVEPHGGPINAHLRMAPVVPTWVCVICFTEEGFDPAHTSEVGTNTDFSQERINPCLRLKLSYSRSLSSPPSPASACRLEQLRPARISPASLRAISTPLSTGLSTPASAAALGAASGASASSTSTALIGSTGSTASTAVVVGSAGAASDALLSGTAQNKGVRP